MSVIPDKNVEKIQFCESAGGTEISPSATGMTPLWASSQWLCILINTNSKQLGTSARESI